MRRIFRYPVSGNSTLDRLWKYIPEPREMSVLLSMVYSLAGLMGLILFLDPRVWRMGGPDLTAHLMIASFLVVGSIISGLAGFFEYWRRERIGLLFLISAMLTYGYLVLVDQAATGVADILHPGTVALACLLFIARRVHIRTFTYRPGVTE